MKSVLLILLSFISCTYANDPVETKSRGEVDTILHPEKTADEALHAQKVKEEADENKFALIIANGNYPKQTKWSNISSHNDIPIIKGALLKKGFPEENIFIVKDATYLEMKRALGNFKEKLNPGDIAYFHYSGHGQQIEDDNGDEPDGYDEALIPTDAHLFYKTGVYEGEKHLRDDEFGEILTGIRKKLTSTGNLLLVIDACHSGTSTRGLAKARGTMQPFKNADYNPKSGSDKNAFGLNEDEGNLAPFAGFFGASPHQLNYEYTIAQDSSVGSLTYAFSKALIDAEPNNTYSNLFERVKMEMASIAPNQNPTSEGTLNQEILGGKIRGNINYFNVKEYQEVKGVAYVTLNGGALSGLHKGSTVELYPSDVENPGKENLITSATIVNAKPLTSIIKLEIPVGEEKAKNAWVLLKNKSFGELGVNVKLDIDNKDLSDLLIKEFGKSNQIKIVEDNPDLIIESNNKFTRGNQVQIYSSADYTLWSQPAADVEENLQATAQTIIDRIRSYGQTKYIRNITIEDPKLRTTFEIIPYEATIIGGEILDSTRISIDEKKNEFGQIIFKEGDIFKLKVKNRGSTAIYFSLLDLMPDGQLSVVIPQGRLTPEDYRLKPGQSIETEAMIIGPPYGTEVFKLVASENPIDLRPIATSRGQTVSTRNGQPNPFEQLFKDSYNDKKTETRGTLTLPTGAVNIFSETFIIREAD